MKKIVLTGMLAALLLLAATGCGAEPEPELPPAEYTVRFLFDGTVLSEQQVQEHTVPTAPVPVLPGLRFLGWDREITAAEADADYEARFAPVLDGYVTGILAGSLAEEPEADRERLLRMSYDYSCDSFTYLRKNAYYFGQTGWEVDDAVVMFSTLRGNCYNYAAAFWSLGRGLGYDAQVISGTITDTNQPHGWVKMMHDGEKYYYDPEMEMTYRIKNNFSKDMFRMPRSYYSGWSYRE